MSWLRIDDRLELTPSCWRGPSSTAMSFGPIGNSPERVSLSSRSSPWTNIGGDARDQGRRTARRAIRPIDIVRWDGGRARHYRSAPRPGIRPDRARDCALSTHVRELRDARLARRDRHCARDAHLGWAVSSGRTHSTSRAVSQVASAKRLTVRSGLAPGTSALVLNCHLRSRFGSATCGDDQAARCGDAFPGVSGCAAWVRARLAAGIICALPRTADGTSLGG